MDEFSFRLPNEEQLLFRLEELREYLQNFPNGIMATAARNEIERLEKIQSEWFV